MISLPNPFGRANLFGRAPRSIGLRATVLVALLLGLPLIVSGCSAPDEHNPSAGLSDPRPPLFEITGPDGKVEGWMLGTMHALPDGVRWRTPETERVIGSAQYLIVEIADLEGESAREAFRSLAVSPDLPALPQRVAPSLRPKLLAMVERIGASPAQFAKVETWAAALSIAQAGSDGKASNGVDRAVIADFSDRRIEEFEGALGQLVIFDTLAQEDQRTLLQGVIIEALDRIENPGELHRAWLKGDIEALTATTTTGIMADANLRAAILTRRNSAWVTRLLGDLRGEPKPLVAVGAAHLVGPDGLAAQLEQRGYTVRSLH